MQRIAVLLLCGGLWATQATADTCTNVGSVVGGFAGGATGYGLITTLGVASNWVAAGLYGAGITVAGLGGKAVGEAGCDSFAANFRRIGEMYCAYSGFNYDCGIVADVTMSLAADFLICPACTYDEVLGAFLLEDGVRGGFLRDMQYRRRGYLATTTSILPRNHLGALNASVMNSYFSGLQAGFTMLRTTAMYRSLK